MDENASFASLALAGLERVRQKDRELRGRVSALLFLLRAAAFTGESKWRRFAEDDLRALWRGGVHDHVGGGFFSGSTDAEWLRPVFEKRLDDNARLACLFTEAWESGRMGFYRAAAEETLDFCLRELATPSGLFAAGRRLRDGADNPFLYTPERLSAVLGEAGRGFGECYDITEEPNCGAASIPNLILNARWSLIPEGYDDLRERLRLEREERGGLVTDTRTPPAANALLLAALAKAGRVFSDRRYAAAAEALQTALEAAAPLSAADRAALCFALGERYAASLDPALLAAAAACAPEAETLLAAAPGAESDRALSLAALGYDALWRCSRAERWRRERGAVLRALCLQPERRGPESLDALCALLAASHTERTLLCLSPDERPPAALAAIRARYAPELSVLLKTPGRAATLAAAAPWTEGYPIGREALLIPFTDGAEAAPIPLPGG